MIPRLNGAVRDMILCESNVNLHNYSSPSEHEKYVEYLLRRGELYKDYMRLAHLSAEEEKRLSILNQAASGRVLTDKKRGFITYALQRPLEEGREYGAQLLLTDKHLDLLRVVWHFRPLKKPTYVEGRALYRNLDSYPVKIMGYDNGVFYTEDPIQLRVREGYEIEPLKWEKNLFRVWDVLAVNTLVEHNIGLARNLARQMMQNPQEFPVLISAAINGLWEAALRYDFRMGRFTTYATPWVKREVRCEHHSRLIKLPAGVEEKCQKMYQLARNIEQDIGRPPTFDEIARRSKLSPEYVRKYIQVLGFPILSLDALVSEDSDATFGDFIEDDSTEDPVGFTARMRCRDKLIELIENSGLSKREQRVIKMHYGIGYRRRRTLEEIGQSVHVTRERVRQIEVDALKKIRDVVEYNGLKVEDILSI